MLARRMRFFLYAPFWLIMTIGCSISSSLFGVVDDLSSDSTLSIDNPAQWSGVSFGTTSDVVFTISNLSSESSVTSLVVSGVSGAFSYPGSAYPGGGTCGTTLSVGDSCTIIVRFTSTGATTVTSTLQVDYTTVSGGAGTISRPLSATGVVATATVVAAYPVNGTNWNQYVKNDGASFYQATDTACDTSETGYYYSACIHAGEKRKVVISGVNSCTGLSLVDDLNVFEWICLVDAGTATFFSKKLVYSAGLKNLIDFSVSSPVWRNNAVTVTQSTIPIMRSSAAAWWANPIAEIPDNSSTTWLSLDGVDDDGAGPDQVYAAGTVFTVSSSRATNGYNFNLDRLALVMNTAAVLSYAGSVTQNCDFWGDSPAVVAPEVMLLCIGGQNFIWVEGSFDGGVAVQKPKSLIYASSVNNSVFRGITLTGAVGEGMSTSGNRSFVSQVKSYGNDTGFANSGSYNIVRDIYLANNTNIGYGCYGGTANIVNNVRISNTGVYAMFLSGDDHIYTNILTSSSQAIINYHPLRGTFSHVTITNSTFNGMYWTDTATSSTVVQTAIMNTGDAALAMDTDSGGHKFSQIAISHTSSDAIKFNNSTGSVFTDNLLLGQFTGKACSSGVGNGGLDDTTCANNNGSDANYVSGVDMTNSFLGKVTTAEAANSSDTLGVATYSSALDWFNFDNFFRLWGKFDAAPFPSSNHQGPCTSGTCQIWDWRLSASDAVIRNRSNTGSVPNAAFVDGAACPAAAHGDYAITDQQTIPNTFLVNALEVMDDDIGDDNGLCESNEACIYSPNFGVYQGEGDYSGHSCIFQDAGGTTSVVGVTLYNYPNNGF